MNQLTVVIGIFCLIFLGCKSNEKLTVSKEKPTFIYESETLKIQQITAKTFVHISYLNTDEWGKVPCNGVIYIEGKEAAVFDTPSDLATTKELIDWIQKERKATLKAVVLGHFHVDALGGLQAFHDEKIPSYAYERTIEFAEKEGFTLPQNAFQTQTEIQIGNQKVTCMFLGEGHTRDNSVVYIPKEKVLFGTCLLKSVNAGKGNLADANVAEWSNTVVKVKAQFPDTEFVVPGHGKMGGTELLDYTIELFKE